ncbi:hypothetical protein DZC31_05510 [Stenotrophomonas rhizophila]|nr:hypothetical protein DZC31_05510 [Stenotrophomonas rhizophila]
MPVSQPCAGCTGHFAGLPAPTGVAHPSRSAGSGQAREEAGTGYQAIGSRLRTRTCCAGTRACHCTTPNAST